MLDKYILIGQTPVLCDDSLEWARWFEDPNNRRIRLTQVGPYFISTVFLGLDHNFMFAGPPILFETMIWIEKPESINLGDRILELDRSFLDEQERCSIYTEAINQHRSMIDKLKHPGDQILELEHDPVDPIALNDALKKLST